MKRFIQTTLYILIALIALSGCKLVSVQDEELKDPPDAGATAGGITLTVYRFSSDTQYINIYRKDITSSTDEEAVVEKIGIIFPSGFEDSKKSYMLEDQWVYKNHKYKYMVRYAEKGDLYYSTAWSEEVQTTAGYNESSPLKYSVGNTKFHFSDTDFTLKIAGTITPPAITDFATAWTPMLAVKCDTSTQVFKIDSTDANSTINLRGLLSSEFMNKDIEILGIIGQKEIKTSPTDGSAPATQWLIWTDISRIEISGHSGNIISITSESSKDGYDFS